MGTNFRAMDTGSWCLSSPKIAAVDFWTLEGRHRWPEALVPILAARLRKVFWGAQALAFKALQTCPRYPVLRSLVHVLILLAN
jgi:hypothetical protein